MAQSPKEALASPGFCALFPRNFLLYAFRVNRHSSAPPRMPQVMTSAMVTYAWGVSSEIFRPDSPIPVAAISATLTSYCRLPITDNRSQGSGMPKLPDRAITPSKMLKAGSSVKVALEMTVFFSTARSMPRRRPARQLFTIKVTHMATTNRIATPTRAYRIGAFSCSSKWSIASPPQSHKKRIRSVQQMHGIFLL